MMMIIGMITFRKLVMLSYLLTKVDALRKVHSAIGEELDALLPSVLRPSGGAFKGEL